jgi:hypothetical protein
MYCPKCGTQNADDASFCRGCGANVSLVPQALAGHTPAPVAPETHGLTSEGRRDRHKRVDPPNLTYAIVRSFVGIAFLLVALAVKNSYQIAGHVWWFWMLIPAAASLGSGVAEFARLYQRRTPQQFPAGSAYVPPAVSQAPRAAEFPPHHAVPDSYTRTSVTENTTKLLDKDQ